MSTNKDNKANEGLTEGEQTNNSKKIQFDENGAVNVTLQKPIKKIGLEHLPDISRYEITRDEEKVNHEVTFSNGGTFSLSYKHDGTLIRSIGKKLTMTITKDNEIVIGIKAKGK